MSDLNFADLSAEQDAPAGLVFDKVEGDTRLTILSMLAAYSAVHRPDLRFDLTGGFRYHDLYIDLA